jgi:hypothetical protein
MRKMLKRKKTAHTHSHHHPGLKRTRNRAAVTRIAESTVEILHKSFWQVQSVRLDSRKLEIPLIHTLLEFNLAQYVVSRQSGAPEKYELQSPIYWKLWLS